mmetsp:Transcript_3800/g.13096  ORF Transcript_3800/g.13096 Transcript_3800/m.13096 type:complete len:288 (+) Transcript_3800:260-1123(+)
MDPPPRAAEAPLEQHLLRVISPRAHASAFISRGVREDGRAPADVRPLVVRVGVLRRSCGSALVHVGDTKVAAAVACQLGVPAPETPSRGELAFDVQLTGLAHPRYDTHTKPSDALVLESRVAALVGPALDTRQLCLAAGRAAWRLEVRLTVLSVGGELTDAAVVAAAAALLDASLPAVDLDDAGGAAPDAAAPRARLVVSRVPAPLTVGLFDGVLLSDPTPEELGVCDAVVTAAADERGEECGLRKAGRGDLGAEGLAECRRRARAWAAVVAEAVVGAFREVEGRGA